MNKWIAEFDLEDGDTMPEHMNLEYMGARLDFHCRPMWIPVSERLPLLRDSSKISDDVLITNGYEIDMGYLVKRKGKTFWHYYGGEYEVGIKDEDNDATAWMPLPAPYKVEREDKE